MTPKINSTFLADYIRRVSGAIDADHEGNHDDFRFGPEQITARDLPRQAVLLQQNGQNLKIDSGILVVHRAIQFVQNCLGELEWVYKNLSDDISRQTLVNVFAYRALGHRKIVLPMNTEEYWAVRRMAFDLPRDNEEIDVGFLGWKLQKVSMESFGYPMTIFANKNANVTTFVHQQYRCVSLDGAIECQAGDYVIDAGACYGDTALYFSYLAGPSGRVASFEFLPQNLYVLKKNLDLNPIQAKSIHVYRNPVWHQSGKELFISGTGPGTKVIEQKLMPDAKSVYTMKIDDLVGTPDFSKVDFIKMDIEGAEQQALRGAEESIRRFKPKLAITVYHSLEDFWEIPKWIAQMELGYQFYLRHFTIHQEETVLFAKCK
jgi:FkbM family methyltransferase